MPLISQSTIEKQQLANVSVEPTAGGASGDVDGIFEPDPMCMLIVVPVSSQAAKNGSQYPSVVDRRQPEVRRDLAEAHGVHAAARRCAGPRRRPARRPTAG